MSASPIFSYAICGDCLHSVSSHEKHNGKYMYCASCFKLCEIEEFNKVNKPTDMSKVIEIQVGREYSPYTPKEHGKTLINGDKEK